MVSATRKRPSSRASGAKAERATLTELDRELVQALAQWYDANRRRLPWRERVDPYATWVSEIMLQQTQVAAVVGYFQRWMQRFPTLQTLAKASIDEVLSLWQGLGYYSRARNLHRSAQRILDDYGGVIPSDVAELRKLPGVGRYTAGAIASIAFDRPEPAVDGNVERVVARLRALRGDPKSGKTRDEIERLTARWVRCDSPRRFNQALMELGALVCVAETPRCVACPLLSLCIAHRKGLVDKLPESRPRPKPSIRHVVVLLSRSHDSLLVVRQPDSAQHWATLSTLPFSEHDATLTPLRAAERLLAQLDPKASFRQLAPVAKLTYPITRFRFHATVFEATKLRSLKVKQLGGQYASRELLAELALPAPHRRILRHLWP